MNKLIGFSILLFLLFLFSCSIGGPAGRYLSHVTRIHTILLKNPEDTSKAAAEVYEYVEKNRELIEKASIEIKELSVEETEKVYVPVIKAVRSLFSYIRNYPPEDQEKLNSALQVFLK
jgi:hypothetical protein